MMGGKTATTERERERERDERGRGRDDATREEKRGMKRSQFCKGGRAA